MDQSTKQKIIGVLALVGGAATLHSAKNAESTTGKVLIGATGGLFALSGISNLAVGFGLISASDGTAGLALSGLALSGDDFGDDDFGALEDDIESEGETYSQQVKDILGKLRALKAECPEEWQEIWNNWMDRAYEFAQKDWANRKSIKDSENERVKNASRRIRDSVGTKRVTAFLQKQGIKGPRIKRIIDELVSAATLHYRVAYSTARIRHLRKAKEEKGKNALKQQINTRLAVLQKYEVVSIKLLKRDLTSLSGLENYSGLALSGEMGAVALSGLTLSGGR